MWTGSIIASRPPVTRSLNRYRNAPGVLRDFRVSDPDDYYLRITSKSTAEVIADHG